MSLWEDIRENIANARANAHPLPDGDLETVEEMIEQGALPEDTDKKTAALIVEQLRKQNLEEAQLAADHPENTTLGRATGLR